MFVVEIDIVSTMGVVSRMMFVKAGSWLYLFVDVGLVVLRFGVVIRGL